MTKSTQHLPGYEHEAPGWAKRVEQLEDLGFTRSEAQGCADVEVMTGQHLFWVIQEQVK